MLAIIRFISHEPSIADTGILMSNCSNIYSAHTMMDTMALPWQRWKNRKDKTKYASRGSSHGKIQKPAQHNSNKERIEMQEF